MTAKEEAKEMITNYGVEKSLLICEEQINKIIHNGRIGFLFKMINKRIIWNHIKRIEKLKIAKT